jgi:hypothetical protein
MYNTVQWKQQYTQTLIVIIIITVIINNNFIRDDCITDHSLLKSSYK